MADRSQEVVLYRVDSKRNMARYYALSIEPSLFGDFLLVRRFGRIRTSERRKMEPFLSWGEAEVRRARILAEKLRRGYRLSLAT